MSYQILVQQLDGTPVGTFQLDTGELVVGRSSDCGIVLLSHDVSRRHARLFIHLGRLYVEDLGSANGVVVDGARISGIVQRQSGPIVIGSFILQVNGDPSAQPIGAASAHTASVPMMPPSLTPQGAPTLTVEVPNETPLSMTLSGDELIVGRSQDATVQLAHSSVSRRHARLVRHDAGWAIEDLSSANGTRVNGHSVDQLTRLSEGDRIEFGDVDAVFSLLGNRLADVAHRARAARRRSAILAIGAGAIAVALAGVFIWRMVDHRAEARADEQAASAERMAVQLQRAVDDEAWADAREVAQAMLAANPDDARAKAGTARADRELAAQTALEACLSSAERADQADSLGDMDSALARILESIRCLERVPSGTAAERDATTQIDGTLGPRLIGLQRRAAGVAMDRQQPEIAVQHLNAAHQRVTTTLSADLAAAEPAIRRELFAARWAAGVRAGGRDAWSEAAAHFRHAAALEPLSEAQRQALAEANARARR
jgi:pSer/pThr/pTyr-binding forkhead associated (FHA) protein